MGCLNVSMAQNTRSPLRPPTRPYTFLSKRRTFQFSLYLYFLSISFLSFVPCDVIKHLVTLNVLRFAFVKGEETLLNYFSSLTCTRRWRWRSSAKNEKKFLHKTHTKLILTIIYERTFRSARTCIPYNPNGAKATSGRLCHTSAITLESNSAQTIFIELNLFFLVTAHTKFWRQRSKVVPPPHTHSLAHTHTNAECRIIMKGAIKNVNSQIYDRRTNANTNTRGKTEIFSDCRVDDNCSSPFPHFIVLRSFGISSSEPSYIVETFEWICRFFFRFQKFEFSFRLINFTCARTAVAFSVDETCDRNRESEKSTLRHANNEQRHTKKVVNLTNGRKKWIVCIILNCHRIILSWFGARHSANRTRSHTRSSATIERNFPFSHDLW